MLIKCPECGRESVSDSAEACPDCGYGIKAHFDKLKMKEDIKRQKQRAEEEKRILEIKIKQQEEQRIRSVPKPSKPKVSKIGLFIGTLIILLSAIQLQTDEWERLNSILYGKGDPSFNEWVCFLLGIGIICFVLYLHGKNIEKYNLAQSDFEEYQKQIIKEQDQAVANAQAQADARARELASRPHCPYCNSQNTTKISSTAKALDTAVFGIYGNKRRHQWYCNNCKSDF